ncbi:hypothetical protein NMG60_11001523 [Bertholletia excelsa]
MSCKASQQCLGFSSHFSFPQIYVYPHATSLSLGTSCSLKLWELEWCAFCKFYTYDTPDSMTPERSHGTINTGRRQRSGLE